jgi:hypothetical protein
VWILSCSTRSKRISVTFSVSAFLLATTNTKLQLPGASDHLLRTAYAVIQLGAVGSDHEKSTFTGIPKRSDKLKETAEQNRTEQNRTEQNRTEQNRTEHNHYDFVANACIL